MISLLTLIWIDKCTQEYVSCMFQKKCEARLSWVEQFTHADLSSLSGWWGSNMDTEVLRGNIESPIGLAQVPIGAVGPLLFDGTNVQVRHCTPHSD